MDDAVKKVHERVSKLKKPVVIAELYKAGIDCDTKQSGGELRSLLVKAWTPKKKVTKEEKVEKAKRTTSDRSIKENQIRKGNIVVAVEMVDDIKVYTFLDPIQNQPEEEAK